MNRKSILIVVIVCTVLVSGVGSSTQQPQYDSQIAAQQQLPADSYVVEQGEFCEPIEPMSSGGSVESFYEYRSHDTHPPSVERQYSSYGTTHLQRNDTSLLFLHDGPDGISLVMVHGRLGGETDGGTVTFELVGVPPESDWAVQDDNYSSDTNMDEFERGGGWANASWVWQDARTDGGAIRGGLDREFAVTVRPAFNNASRFSTGGDLYDPDFDPDGEISDWEILSESTDDPDRLSLPSLDEPVTIRTGTCDGPSVTYDRTDSGIAVTVDEAGSDEPITLQTSSGSSDDVQFERIELSSVNEEFDLGSENRRPDDLSASPDSVEPFAYLTVTSDGLAADTGATVTFKVAKDRLDRSSTEPEDVALYERDDGAWRQTSTAILDESDDSYTFLSNVSTVSGYAVAPSQPETSDSTDGSPNIDDDSDSTSGFNVVITIGAVLLLVGARAKSAGDE